MINTSVLVQDITIDSIRFVLSMCRDGVVVKYLIVAPDTGLHPKRLEQLDIRQQVFGNNIYSSKSTARRWVVAAFNFAGIKRHIVFAIASIIGFLRGFKVCSFQGGWSDGKCSCYDLVTIMYSFEGIISESVLRRFPLGIINIHPAVIPQYRGLDAGLWALYEGGKLGVSAYKVDKGIDTGCVIKTYLMARDEVKSVGQYLTSLKKLKITSYHDALRCYVSGRIEISAPKIEREQNRGVMPKDTLIYLVNTIG
jgi:hypothetical protein